MTEKCKGLVFRGYNYVFKRKSGHYEQQQGFRLLKRDSCSGCGYCGGLLDLADDTIWDCVYCLHDKPVENNHKYQLTYWDEDFHWTDLGQKW